MKAVKASHNIMGSGLFVLLLLLTKTVSGGTIVKYLPGYDGELPFTLETGNTLTVYIDNNGFPNVIRYVGVGENEEVQLFYYFVPSQSSPLDDPLMLWIPGGPGCSGLTALFFENGPLTIDVYNYGGSGLPTLLDNPYTWTRNLSIIFLDGPVGTGFSYSKTTEGYNTGDYKFTANTYEFLQKWFVDHSDYSKTPLYIAGDGYSGAPVPLVVQTILDGETAMNIAGYVLGNPGTDKISDFNARTTIVYRLALIPEDLYLLAFEDCDNGNFTTENPTPECQADLQLIYELTKNVNPTNILQPACGSGIPGTALNLARRSLMEKSENFLRSVSDDSTNKECASYIQGVCETWANDEEVQEALNVIKGTITTWAYCNNSLHPPIYNQDVSTVVSYHQNFAKTNLQGLIYSGDHDTGIPYIGTENWIKSLDLTLVRNWSVWSVDNETAGYTRRFTNSGSYNLTYATVKGAGHYAATDKMKECSVMVNKWMANIPL